MTNILRGLGFTLLLWISLFASQGARAAAIDGFLTEGLTNIHYGVYDSSAETQGDILYFHGYGDRFENHSALFDEFNQAGFRVIAFDLPSHGDTNAAAGDEINKQTFDRLVTIASQVLSFNRGAEDRKPLLLAGWSLGGLIASRIAQDEKFRVRFPQISGLILYAPGVAPKPCVGNFLCHITNDTLTHNPELRDRDIKPNAPLKNLLFAARIAVAAAQSWTSPFPNDLSTLVFVADDDDQYVLSSGVKDWVTSHRANYISRVPAYHCKGAKHELDNEPAEFGGAIVRSLSVEFASAMVRGDVWDTKIHTGSAPCSAF